MTPRVAIATTAGVGDEWPDDAILAGELGGLGAEAAVEPWDGDAQWSAYDLVVVRSTWDYTWRREEFLAWADRVGPRLRNSPELLRWNSDKRYLADLGDAGIPVVPTVFAGPGDPPPALSGEIVVKPAVSAGARLTGRFGPGTHGAARGLLEEIRAEGGTAMVQPYLESADTGGETAVVFIGGRRAHVLHKKAVLSPDEVAPMREGGIAAAEAMFLEDLVTAGAAGPQELELAERVVGFCTERFGRAPLYARVDMLEGPGGAPVLLELEAVEPNLYLETAPEAAGTLARAILAEATPR